MEKSARAADFRNMIIDEIIYALGYARDGWQRKVLGPLFWPPANRFSKIIVDFNLDVERHGVNFASSELIKPFIKSSRAVGIENVPEKGPLVIASNHPGAYDGFVTISYLPREDIKVVVSGVPFLMNLPVSSNYLIYTSTDTHKRIRSVREILRHLKNGGLLLIYPSGKIDPDPAILAGAEKALEAWSPSLELFLKKVPQTRILPAIVSGVLSPGWLSNPITCLPREKWRRQKLAEFFQIMQQMFIPGSIQLSPSVVFGQSMKYTELKASGENDNIMDAIIEQAKKLYRSQDLLSL